MKKLGISSVFQRLFLLLLMLMIVVCAAIIGLFIRYVQQQKQIELSSQITKVSNSASVIEQQIQAIENVEVELLNNTQIKKLSLGLYENDYEKSIMTLDLLGSIQNTQSINKMIDDIILLFPKEGIELSARNGYHRYSYRSAPVPSTSNTSNATLHFTDSKLQMQVSFPLKDSLEEGYVPDYEIRIVLSQSYLDDFLEHFRHDNQQNAFWVYDDGNTRIPLFTEDSSKSFLLAHWDEGWLTENKPAFSVEEHSCQRGRYLCITNTLACDNLILFTYVDNSTLAQTLSFSLLQMIVVMLVVLLLFWCFLRWANGAVNIPIRKVMEAFELLRSGDMSIRIIHKANDEFGYIYDSFNDTVCNINKLIEDVKEQKELLQNAELMQLQSQINPHFLYNSFYNLKFLAQNEECEQIETFVTALAKYYRFLNKETSMDVPLVSEVAHMENYIEIQQMRFGDKITVRIQQLPDQIHNLTVPKLILQPIVENAYNYGLKDTLDNGLLHIGYTIGQGRVSVIIEDNGHTLTDERLDQVRQQICTFEGESIRHALTNINRRLNISFGQPYGLTLDRSELGGMKVTVSLPYQNNCDIIHN